MQVFSLLVCLPPGAGAVVARDAWDAGGHLGLVLAVPRPEEWDERVLLDVDPLLEEGEAGPAVQQEADGVAEHQLRAHRPEEPADIAGVAAPGVHAPGHQLVVRGLVALHQVVEAGARLQHGGLP